MRGSSRQSVVRKHGDITTYDRGVWGYTVSESDTWLGGVYSTEEAAILACSAPVSELQRIWGERIAYATRHVEVPEPLTLADVRSLFERGEMPGQINTMEGE